MMSFTRIALLSFIHQNPLFKSHPRTAVISSSPPSLFVASTSSSSSSVAFLVSTTTTLLLNHKFSSSSPLFCEASSSSLSSLPSSSQETAGIMSLSNDIHTGYLNAQDAYDLDQHLFATGYTLEQLMELAGLAVAEAIYDVSPPTPISSTRLSEKEHNKKKRVLIVCGPGNNGGDGLVAARHLVMFGYDVRVIYPKRSKREPHYEKLVKQCEDVGVEVLDELPPDEEQETTTHNDDEKKKYSNYDIIVDAIFGFSFKAEAREPFGSIIQKMITMQQSQRIPIFAVDVPSGWNVDEGDVANTGMIPDILISLTAPKLCSNDFQGRHFVGGRFLPPAIAEKYGIQMPPYPGVRQVMEINTGSNKNSKGEEEEDWALQYQNHCIEKEMNSNNGNKKEVTDEDWAVQYQNYCIEKEKQLKEKEEAMANETKNIGESDEEDWTVQYQNYYIEKEKKLKS